MTQNFNTRSGALWVQPDGPNFPVYFLGCHDLDDVTVPITGGKTPVRKFNPNGRGWVVVGKNEAPPDNITTTITALLFSQKDWLEKLNCPFTLFILMRDCGVANVFTNYKRGWALRNSTPVNLTLSNLAQRGQDEEAESTAALEINADFPLVFIDPLEVDRLTTTEINSANGVWTNRDGYCYGDCGDTLNEGDLLAVAPDSAVGPATANILFSDDAGDTIAAGATDPFGAGLHAMAVTSFMVGAATRRYLAAKEGTGGAVQGSIAYSDDEGATWTEVSIGGAAVGHGAVTGRGLWALDSRHIWLAGVDGYIYFSSDGGATWAAVEAGAVTATNYNCIHFVDENYGMAGAPAGLVAISNDGGVTWEAVNAPSAGDVLGCFRQDVNRMWVTTDDGELYFSRDGGVTWTERTGWTGSGSGTLTDIEFYDDLIGFMIHNTAAPLGTVLRTIDGGYTWDVLTTPTNLGLNDLAIAAADVVYVAGEAQGGTAVILKVTTA